MTDNDFDEALSRYRPAGPPPELRARVVGAVRSDERAWPWAAAAAALLAAVCVMQLSTRTLYDRARTSVSSNEPPGLDQWPALSSAIGEDTLLRERIERMSRRELLENRAVHLAADQ